MSANINYNELTNTHSFFSVKQKAWHGLGQIVESYPTSAEAMEYAGLNFYVEKRPLFTYDSSSFSGEAQDGIMIPDIAVPDYFATIRRDTDQPLGVVGKDYVVVQNAEAFAFFDAIVGGGKGIRYETAGALGKGERIFITAKLPNHISVGNDDLIEQYLFLTTSHDGSGAITAAFTPVRIVCQNTLNAALKDMSNVIRIRHTENAKDRLNEAHRILGLTNRLGEDMEKRLNHWAKVRITDPELKQLIQMAMAPSDKVLEDIKTGNENEFTTAFKNTCDSVFSYAMSAESQQFETTKGTVFGAYNAITGYYQNVKSYRDDESKLKSLLYGGTAQRRGQKAFDICKDFASTGLLLN